MDILNFNISIAAIPAYYLIGFGCHVYAQNILVSRDPEKKVYDNRNPRVATQEALHKLLGPADFERYTRARGANSNSHENFPLFAAAVLAGNLAGLGQRTLNAAAVTTILLRVVYSFTYVMVTTRRQALLRSLIYGVTTFIKFYVLFKAAGALAAKPENGPNI